MPLGIFRPGVHTVTYGDTPVDLGLTTSAGWRLRWRDAMKKINDTNSFGESLIDGIYRGKSDMKLIVTLKEWSVQARKALWPWGSTTIGSVAFDGKLGNVGWLASDHAQSIILTAEAGSPAATVGDVAGTPGTAWNLWTFHKCILAPENDLEILFGPDETDVPAIFDVLLTDQSGTKRFFTPA